MYLRMCLIRHRFSKYESVLTSKCSGIPFKPMPPLPSDRMDILVEARPTFLYIVPRSFVRAIRPLTVRFCIQFTSRTVPRPSFAQLILRWKWSRTNDFSRLFKMPAKGQEHLEAWIKKAVTNSHRRAEWWLDRRAMQGRTRFKAVSGQGANYKPATIQATQLTFASPTFCTADTEHKWWASTRL